MLRVTAVLFFAVLLLSGCTPPAENAVSADAADAIKDVATSTATADSAPAPPAPPQPAVPGKLTVGDPAPPIAVSQWIKGDPIDGLVADKVNVVEFWATWCGPCLRNMPHLSQLQDEYGDKINVMGFTREDADTVTQFMTMEQSAGKTWDEVLTYRIAIDDDAKTNKAYMQAAEQRGIPCAFIVGKDGYVEWIGHPAAMDEPLASVVDGNWDREAAIAEREKQKQTQEAMAAFGQGLNQAMASQDFDAALAMIDDFGKDRPEMKIQLTMTRAMILGQAERYEEQTQAFQQVIAESPENAGLLNQIAWQVATETKNGDLDFALKTALQASEVSDHSDPSILDTVARVHYELGDLASATEWQTKAVDAAPDVAPLKKTLSKYQDELKAAAEKETDAENAAQRNAEEGIGEQGGEASAENGEDESSEDTVDNDQADPAEGDSKEEEASTDNEAE